MAQPTHPPGAQWSDLPGPLAAHILRLALRDSGRALLQWLRLSLVCRHARSDLYTQAACHLCVLMILTML